jgi:hypothetical protein
VPWSRTDWSQYPAFVVDLGVTLPHGGETLCMMCAFIGGKYCKGSDSGQINNGAETATAGSWGEAWLNIKDKTSWS